MKKLLLLLVIPLLFACSKEEEEEKFIWTFSVVGTDHFHKCSNDTIERVLGNGYLATEAEAQKIVDDENKKFEERYKKGELECPTHMFKVKVED